VSDVPYLQPAAGFTHEVAVVTGGTHWADRHLTISQFIGAQDRNLFEVLFFVRAKAS